MRQVVEIRELPRCDTTEIGLWGRLRLRVFGSEGARIAQLDRCSDHLLRDIGLLDDRRGHALLRDDLMFRR
jgi:hypothetical protein